MKNENAIFFYFYDNCVCILCCFFDRNKTWFGLAELILSDLYIVCNDFIKFVII